MAVSPKTIKIKAIADDPRGNPATRAIAQKKLEQIFAKLGKLHPLGYYNNIANWKVKKEKQQVVSYYLDIYMFKIHIYNTRKTGKPFYQWEVRDTKNHKIPKRSEHARKPEPEPHDEKSTEDEAVEKLAEEIAAKIEKQQRPMKEQLQQ
jgi:hypothetical protein